jgi:hypothetical protein
MNSTGALYQWDGRGTPAMFCILEGSANIRLASDMGGRQVTSEPPMQLWGRLQLHNPCTSERGEKFKVQEIVKLSGARQHAWVHRQNTDIWLAATMHTRYCPTNFFVWGSCTGSRHRLKANTHFHRQTRIRPHKKTTRLVSHIAPGPAELRMRISSSSQGGE